MKISQFYFVGGPLSHVVTEVDAVYHTRKWPPRNGETTSLACHTQPDTPRRRHSASSGTMQVVSPFPGGHGVVTFQSWLPQFPQGKINAILRLCSTLNSNSVCLGCNKVQCYSVFIDESPINISQYFFITKYSFKRVKNSVKPRFFHWVHTQSVYHHRQLD